MIAIFKIDNGALLVDLVRYIQNTFVERYIHVLNFLIIGCILTALYLCQTISILSSHQIHLVTFAKH